MDERESKDEVNSVELKRIAIWTDSCEETEFRCNKAVLEEDKSASTNLASDEPPAKKAKTEVVNDILVACASLQDGDAKIIKSDAKASEESINHACSEVETPSLKAKEENSEVQIKEENSEVQIKEENSEVQIKEENCAVQIKEENCEAQTKPNEAASAESSEIIPAQKKKKVALLLAYCGAGYFGMQKNPDVNTIEDELIDALYKAGAIRGQVKDDLGKMSFQRCARTDKGVSAAAQVVSLKMVPDFDLLPEINKHLPPSIRVFGMNRVTKGFDSKTQCSARTYQYLLPTFAFAPTEILTISGYRIKPATIELINETLKFYCGTHNFHNFTSGKSFTDPSSKRYIMSFEAGEQFVKKGYEFITLSITGQSFMLHQIRKMIGLCIAICRGFCNSDVIEKSWLKDKVDIPKAPGLGLILDKVHYDRYNQRFGTDGVHEPVSWKNQQEEIQKFKNSFIWDAIIESEITQKSMLRWLSTLNIHTYGGSRQPDQHQSAKKE